MLSSMLPAIMQWEHLQRAEQIKELFSLEFSIENIIMQS